MVTLSIFGLDTKVLRYIQCSVHFISQLEKSSHNFRLPTQPLTSFDWLSFNFVVSGLKIILLYKPFTVYSWNQNNTVTWHDRLIFICLLFHPNFNFLFVWNMKLTKGLFCSENNFWIKARIKVQIDLYS